MPANEKPRDIFPGFCLVKTLAARADEVIE
jgi:hypothetical protein